MNTVMDVKPLLEPIPLKKFPNRGFLSVEQSPLFAYLSPVQRVMLINDGNLTNLLQAYFLEPVRNRVVAQRIIKTGDLALVDKDLLDGDVSEESFLQRQVILYGLTTSRPYVYAESLLALSRLPRALVQELQRGDLPLGRLWLKHRLETFKEFAHLRVGQAETVSQLLEPAGELLERTYRVVSQGRVCMVIHEYFPATLGR